MLTRQNTATNSSAVQGKKGARLRIQLGEELWLAAGQISPKRVFVTHGEPAPAAALRRRLRDTFGWNVTVPEQDEVVRLQ